MSTAAAQDAMGRGAGSVAPTAPVVENAGYTLDAAAVAAKMKRLEAGRRAADERAMRVRAARKKLLGGAHAVQAAVRLMHHSGGGVEAQGAASVQPDALNHASPAPAAASPVAAAACAAPEPAPPAPVPGPAASPAAPAASPAASAAKGGGKREEQGGGWSAWLSVSVGIGALVIVALVLAMKRR